MSNSATLIGASVLGAGTGWLVGGGTSGIVVGFVVGLLLGGAAAWLDVRLVVSLSVVVGTVAGAFIGRNIVRALCLPGTCSALEITAAVLTGIGAFIGIGLVVALVTRSFDEYHEAVARDRPPPRTGCGPDTPGEPDSEEPPASGGPS